MTQVVEYFEIVLPRCANTYGVAPCTAGPPPECFQCLGTCQDIPNFVDATATIRFAKPASYLPRDIDIVGPWIKLIEHTSATISLAENLGTRAVLKVTLEDHRHSDAGEGLDPYHADRGYNPYERGSFWPRFCARYPSLDGVECAWIIGEAGQSLAEMERRVFFIEGAPSGDGTVTITAKDALKFLDGAKAQIPVLSEGFLTAGISNSATSFTISPGGAGADYPTPGYIRIAGKEDCSFTRSGDVFTIVRGALGTTAASHSSGDRVQLVKRYASVAAADIIADAIENYSDLPAGYIPLVEWQLEDSTNLGTLYTFVLGEPTGVGAFVSRVLEQCGSMLWDDALEQQLRFRVIKAVPPAADVISEANVINKTFELIGQPEQRVSRAWVYYGINDPTKRRDDLDNYRQVANRPDEDTAVASERLYGSQALRKIVADGIAIGGGSVAQRVGNLVVGRKQRPPRRVKWSMFREEPNLPASGGGYYIDWRSLQDASGLRELVPVQVISCKVSATVNQYIAEEMRFTDLDTGSSTDRVLLINFDGYNLNLRAIHDLTYPSTFVGVTVEFIISATIGSTSTSVPAVTVGDWSDAGGLTPLVTLTGRIQGKGGNGGTGSAGGAGGVALYTRSAIDLDIGSGAIWSGGGGGGAGSGDGGFPYAGGGGGAGQNPGMGGTGLNGSGDGAAGSASAGGAGGTGDAGFKSGGAGGGPGLAGATGNTAVGPAYPGATAGAAIDGVSFVNVTAGPGDIRGGQIN